MSNSIGRIRTLGIGVEATYGTPVSPTFVLPLLDTPRVEIVQNKERNIAPLGSSYQANDLKMTTRQSNVSFEVKIDEDQLPIFFKQKFTFASGLITGETSCYEHVLTYSNSNDGSSYTLFLQDSNRTSLYITGVKFSKVSPKADKGYITLTCDGIGKFPVTWTGTNTVVQPKEFVGKNVSLNLGATTSTKSDFATLTATLNHNFKLSGDAENFVLGNTDLSHVYTTEDEFTTEVDALFPDFTVRDLYTNNTAVQYDVTITDTVRHLVNSTANLAPLVKFEYPVGYIEQWSEEGGLADLLKQKLTLLPVDDVGTAGAPLKITVRNKIASY